MNAKEEDTFVQAVMGMEKLIAKSKDHKSTALKSFIVAFYTADDQNPLRFSGKIGMLQLDFDRGVKYHFLRLYDLQTLQLLLELQLFYGFGENYRKSEKDNLYIFDFFADGIIGFEFRNKQQASSMAAKIKAVSPKSQQLKKLFDERRQKQIQQKKQSSFFGKVKKKFGSLIHTQAVHQESVVLKVQKQKSIVMNFDTGQFDCSNVPPQWEEILTNAGLKKEDLKNKQVARLVFEQTLLHQAKKAAQQNAGQVKKQHLKMIQQTQIEDDHDTAGSQKDMKVTGGGLIDSQQLPSIPTLNLPDPVLTTPQIVRKSTNRNDLMAQIRNNNLKLKPVKATQKGVEIDASSMNKQQRNDLAEHIRIKLQKRKLALNRRKSSDQQD